MTFDEIFAITATFLMASVLFYAVYKIFEHQRKLMNELKEMNK